MKIVGAMRAKNEARWIRRAVESILPACAEVFVLDDNSEDLTVLEAEEAGGRVVRSHFEGLDEVRDKNFMLDWIGTVAPDTDWIIMIDGDEVLEEGKWLRLKETIEFTKFDSLSLPILYLWDQPDQVRIDGVYGDFMRESAFRFTSERFRMTSNGGNFHCGNVPAWLRRNRGYVNAPLLHYGYMDRADRLRKYAWYNAKDPGNKTEDGYRHMVIGDLPEFPATMKTQHAGPLAFRAL